MKDQKHLSISDTSEENQDLGFIKIALASALFLNLSVISYNKEDFKQSIDKQNLLDLDLEKIGHIESNSGKNLNHPIVKYGINRGDRAGGQFGLMPITAKETVSKNPLLKLKYGHILNLSNKQVTIFLNNDKKASDEIASSHWKRLKKIFPNDKLKRVYAWNCGITCALKASKQDIINSKYVKKFLNK